MKNRIKFTALILSGIFALICLLASCSGSANPDTPSDGKTYYKVTFDSDGGSSVATQKVESGKKAIKPNNPSKDDYDFDGWYIEYQSYDFDSAVEANITLKAHWKIKKYQVIFDTDNGYASVDQYIEAGQKIDKPNDKPKKEGFVFVGWYIGDTEYDFSKPVKSDITLKAKWIDENDFSYAAIDVTADTIARTIRSLDESRTLKATGNFTNEVITEIRDALTTLYKEKQEVLVSLDLSTITGLTELGSNAFYNCSNLASIIIPDTITSISYFAFYNCSALTDITIPNNVTTIGYYAFSNCYRLTSITIPNNVTSIDSGAFSGCSALTSITIPNNVTTIGSYAFSKCYKLTSITIPDTITSIDDGTFSNCSALTSITIPNSVTSIGDSTFSNCSALTSITIPNSVTSIGDYTFSNCSALTSIVIPDSVTSIGKYILAKCISLEEISIPYIENPNDETDSDEKYCFGYNFGKEYIKGTESVNHLNKYYFYIPSTLKKVTISGNKIPDSFFKGYKNLTDITLPEGINSIGYLTFSECSALRNITIPNSVTSIGDYAFSECSALTNISIPNSVTNIGESAFYRSALTSITIPNSVTSIGKYAFNECHKLTNITILDGVTSIGDKAFSYCDKLTSIAIPETVTSIGTTILLNCESLEEITTPCIETNSPEKDLLGYYFYNAPENPPRASVSQKGRNGEVVPSSLKKVTIIGDKLLPSYFHNCSNIQYITMSDSITSIGRGAFYGCSSLTSITIPDSVTSIGYSAFSGCSGLTNLTIPDSVTSIGYSAFSDCSGLTNIIFENKSGWKAGNTEISETDLNDEGKAATLLKITYYSENWTRSDN